ncbi:hypothetical protein [Caldimonas brevitalea]|uniref:Uncharacterized protein n=1 Tax=Caldimonas brevitalea TaxID=413882 RepID=A0A0G3BPV8_9BURK|nr:hypothetical protein [Caldimonas brevitalea]AKJ29381.1 hypothetical protein AAW51_2690 [Caldimonas brevitalea]
MPVETLFRRICLALLGLYALVFVGCAYGVIALDLTHLFAEDGTLEMLEAAVLAVACVVFLVGAARRPQPQRLILLFLALLMLAFSLRELDVERFDVPELVKQLGAGKGRNVLLGSGLALIVGYASLRFGLYWRAGFGFLHTTAGKLLLWGGAFVVLGELFEKYFLVPHHVLFEESFELLGYCLIVLCGVAAQLVPTSTVLWPRPALPRRN